jgi:hypothetical protein
MGSWHVFFTRPCVENFLQRLATEEESESSLSADRLCLVATSVGQVALAGAPANCQANIQQGKDRIRVLWRRCDVLVVEWRGRAAKSHDSAQAPIRPDAFQLPAAASPTPTNG